jgi:CheY-like chemotaxis protein
MTSILIVDDDPQSAKMLGVLLRIEGCDIRIARTAEEALEALHDFAAEVVLVELVLRGASGFTLVEQLRALPAGASLTILAVTSLNGDDARQRALAAGCDDYLRKPIDALTFMETLHRILAVRS